MPKKQKDQSKSQQTFHNLELLCKADEKQKKTLQKIIKQKPELAKSLNIYADGVKFYIARQELRNKLLSNVVPEEQLSPQLPIPVLTTNRRELIISKKNKLRMLSEEKQNKSTNGIVQINPANYTPFANRQVGRIPSLLPPKNQLQFGKEAARLKLNYYLGAGNNSELVKQIMAKRESHWSQVPYQFAYKHFQWQQTFTGMDFNKLQPSDGIYSKVMYNFFEFHKNITTKTGLTQSLLQYHNNIDKTFNIIPLVFQINFRIQEWNKDLQLFLDYFHKNNPLEVTSNKVNLDLDFYIPNIQQGPFNSPNILRFKLQDTLLANQYLWLLKPADWNRGEGVHVFGTLEELEALIKQYYNGKGSYECKEFVIQKYIEKPLLVEGRKFDIRCWALVSQDQQLFLFQEAYIRTSGFQFSLNTKDRFIHLTNNAVQKNAQTYGQFENGNQLSLEQLQKILDVNENPINFREKCWPVIKDYVKQVMSSTKINKRNRKYSMQLFGYDFMIDENYKVWLIEVNANPCIEESSPLLKMLIPRMLDDAFKITIDQVFTPEYDFGNTYSVIGYMDEINMWELLGIC